MQTVDWPQTVLPNYLTKKTSTHNERQKQNKSQREKIENKKNAIPARDVKSTILGTDIVS